MSSSCRCYRRRPAGPLLSLLAVAVALTLAAAARPLRAETLHYPKDDPTFSIALPDGWKTQFDSKNNVLTAQPAPDRAIVLTLGEMEGVDDLPAARAALPKLVALIAKGSDVSDVQPKGDPQEGKTAKKVSYVAQEFTGKNKAGTTLVLSPLAFQVEEDGEVYMMMVVGSEEEDEKFGKDGMAVLASITAE